MSDITPLSGETATEFEVPFESADDTEPADLTEVEIEVSKRIRPMRMADLRKGLGNRSLSTSVSEYQPVEDYTEVLRAGLKRK